MKQIINALADCSYQELEKIEKEIKNLKLIKGNEHVISLREKYRKNKAAADKAAENFNRIKPFIVDWLYLNLKPGDIITCKGYKGFKKVTELRGNTSVYAMCGHFRSGNFIPNGSGSETTLYYVTEIYKDGKFQKIKDLVKKHIPE